MNTTFLYNYLKFVRPFAPIPAELRADLLEDFDDSDVRNLAEFCFMLNFFSKANDILNFIIHPDMLIEEDNPNYEEAMDLVDKFSSHVLHKYISSLS